MTRQLSLTNLRELLRDPTTFFFLLVFPFLFIGLYAFISTTTQGSFDTFRFGLPGVLVLAFGQLAFIGTTTALVQLRARGTLRLLSLTPVTKRAFAASIVPPRLAIAGVQITLMAVVAIATGYLAGGDVARLLLSSLFGLAMLFSIGIFLGGRLRSPEVASGLLSAIFPLLMIVAGVFVPLSEMPDAVRTISDWIPLTYLGDALRQDLVGGTALHSIGVDYAVMGGTALIFTALTALTFRWDDGEKA
ncbi:ABC transporter permease [Patulibacter minatonensis]|uniref:ABC transporter permease n=1 Tax=Patulibacter minatonensis TaxID=298163 RepID=UPI00047D0211|nr:ABC transporter permease [Patulibacter minatonensis]